VEGSSAQPALARPPPTGLASSTNEAATTAVQAVPTSDTVLAAVPAVPPIVPPGIPGPISPPTTSGELAAVYLTPLARSSRGVHPTVLNVLPDIVSAPESGSWYVVTVGRYTGIYPEWCVLRFPSA